MAEKYVIVVSRKMSSRERRNLYEKIGSW